MVRKCNTGQANPNYKTGYATSAASRRGLYNSWQNMKQRCTNPNHPKYHCYGGRGIKICDEWLLIEGFAKWALSSGWVRGLTIDRINNDGDYEPSNCRWVSHAENSRKKSTTKLTYIQAGEIRRRLAEGESAYALAKEYGVAHGTIWFIEKRFTHVPDGECTKKIRKNRS